LISDRDRWEIVMEKWPMAYAIFKHGYKLSRTFATKEQAFKKAEQAGLADTAGDQPILEDDLRLERCRPDLQETNDEDLDWVVEKDRSGNDGRP
jgi:hypothetical protein